VSAGLTGSIPADISRLPALKHLFLSFNQMSGSLEGVFCTQPKNTLQVRG
jgi:hypothetical protein